MTFRGDPSVRCEIDICEVGGTSLRAVIEAMDEWGCGARRPAEGATEGESGTRPFVEVVPFIVK